MTRQAARHGTSSSGFAIVRSGVISLGRALSLGISSAAAAPIGVTDHHDNLPAGESDGARWILFIVSIALVLLGGAFAGLTIAFMGQDSIYLQVVAGDPYEHQSKNARRVYDLLKKGKHWVLVTLLLSNVIVNETLPVVLDRCLGGGVAAVVGSTVLIVIFGEVVPQSVCVRYGLQIGGIMAKPVLLMMWVTAPVSWPIAKLLDWALGEDHGTIYKKSGLKTLVTLHKSLGDVGERLNQDEVTIISAVLDLKEKSVANVMTPMDDVFVMAEDTILDEQTMDRILSQGYSRIPIHAPGRPKDFVGMLLVKILITYDPEDCCQVRDFPLATLPETRPETSCLDIVNFFQEGKSHMVLVSESPGDDYGALGVVTLEDVIEELIGEEIIDESDVYIDVHKAIRRLTPAPKARPLRKDWDQSTQKPSSTNGKLIDIDDPEEQPRRKLSDSVTPRQNSPSLSTSAGKRATFMMRRSSEGPDGQMQASAVPVKANLEDIKRQLRHLGPSNRNTNPRDTKSTTVKIKSVLNPTHAPPTFSPSGLRPASVSGEHLDSGGNLDSGEHLDSAIDHDVEEGDENTPLLRPLLSGKDGVEAVRQRYGGAGTSDAQTRLAEFPLDQVMEQAATGTDSDGPQLQMPTIDTRQSPARSADGSPDSNGTPRPDLGIASDAERTSSQASVVSVTEDGATTPRCRNIVRSGSISENVVETSSGVRKIIIQASSSDSEDGSKGSGSGSRDGSGGGSVSGPSRIPSSLPQSRIPPSQPTGTTADKGEVDGHVHSEGSGFGNSAYGDPSNSSQSGQNNNNNGADGSGAGTGSTVAKKKNKKKKKKGKF